jgi:hypothetical protein
MENLLLSPLAKLSAAQEGEDARKTTAGGRTDRHRNQPTGLRDRRGLQRGRGVALGLHAGRRIADPAVAECGGEPRQGRGLPDFDRAHQRRRGRTNRKCERGGAAAVGFRTHGFGAGETSRQYRRHCEGRGVVTSIQPPLATFTYAQAPNKQICYLRRG